MGRLSSEVRCSSGVPNGQRTGRAKVVALGAVADVELGADDRPQHRMGAVDELAVDDGVEAHVGRDGDRSAAVPTDAMTFFGGHDGPTGNDTTVAGAPDWYNRRR
jgi:hypothetical protein